MKLSLFDIISVVILATSALFFGIIMLTIGMLFQLFGILERVKNTLISFQENQYKNLFPRTVAEAL